MFPKLIESPVFTSLFPSTEPCLTMTRAKTVASRAKDSVLSMETSFTSSTPRTMNGGRQGGSLWRETVRRWELYPARGGECCLLLPTSLAMILKYSILFQRLGASIHWKKWGKSRKITQLLFEELEDMILAVRFKELRLFNCTEKKLKRWLNYSGLVTSQRKGGRGKEHHVLKSFGRKRNNQNPSLGISSEFEVEHLC